MPAGAQHSTVHSVQYSAVPPSQQAMALTPAAILQAVRTSSPEAASEPWAVKTADLSD